MLSIETHSAHGYTFFSSYYCPNKEWGFSFLFFFFSVVIVCSLTVLSFFVHKLLLYIEFLSAVGIEK